MHENDKNTVRSAQDVILDSIEEDGYFIQGPDFWSEEFGTALKELVEVGLLVNVADYKPEAALMDNNSYTYIEVGNPRNLEFRY